MALGVARLRDPRRQTTAHYGNLQASVGFPLVRTKSAEYFGSLELRMKGLESACGACSRQQLFSKLLRRWTSVREWLDEGCG